MFSVQFDGGFIDDTAVLDIACAHYWYCNVHVSISLAQVREWCNDRSIVWPDYNDNLALIHGILLCEAYTIE